jgi:hypothetical protein
MPPVDSILGIRDLVVERVERGREIHVWGLDNASIEP